MIVARGQDTFEFDDGGIEARPRADVSVVLPTYNEAENIATVIDAVRTVLRDTPDHEILVVDDDSPDGTWRLVEEIGRRNARVRILRRIGRRGLASAIVEGLASATGQHLIVMDADLQHNPSVLVSLLAALDSADIVVASRYVEGGSTGEWSHARRWISRMATILGRRVLGLSTSDPMSGFFAVRRETFQAVLPRLRPRGFKALMEILFQARPARVAEVPYRFEVRRAGDSKLRQSVVLDYLWSLLEIRGRDLMSSRFTRYCLVGLSGVAVQLLFVATLQAWFGENVALGLAIFAAMCSNFTLNNLWTFRDRRLSRAAFGTGLIRFVAISAVGAVLNHFVTMQVHLRTGIALAGSSLAGIAVATVWNYQLNRGITWRKIATDPDEPRSTL